MKMRKIARWAISAMLLSTCAVGQIEDKLAKQESDPKARNTPADERKARRAIVIQNLILTAKAQSPEVSADLLFRIVGSRLELSPSVREELVEDIFRRASEAKEPIKLKQHVGLIDTRSGYSSISYELNLDRLSIQLRAVRLMLPINKAKARELFRQIPRVKAEPLSCENSLDYEFSEFYKVLRQVVDETFDSEARTRREHLFFAMSVLDQIDSPSQLAPAIDFLVSVRATKEDFRILLDSFISALKGITGDPRTFASSIRYGGVTGKLRSSLVRKMQESGVDTDDLLRNYRRYLAKHLSATQCSDTLMTIGEKKSHEAIDQANILFENKLGEDDVKPERIDPGAKLEPYWRSVKAADLLKSVKNLRFGEGRVELSLSERNSQEWLQKFSKVIEQMSAWKSEDEETDVDYLHQKSVLYFTLIELAPQGPMNTTVLREYALFLRDNNLQKSGPLHWLHYAKDLLKIGNRLKGEAKEQFDNTVTSAGNQPFIAYLELDRLLRETTPR